MKTEGIKQRGLGAVALLVLAGVVWLLLFGTDPEPAIDTRSHIPPAPEQTPFEVAEPRIPDDIEPVDTPLLPKTVGPAPSGEPGAESAVVDDARPPTATEPLVADPQPIEPAPRHPAEVSEPGLDSRGLPEAWVVQVVSLSNAGNAMQMRDRLREQGYKAYTETVDIANGTAVRVLVGPKLSREQAERDKVAIDKALGLSSLVMRFDPGSGR